MKTLLSISILFTAGSNASEQHKGKLEIFCPVSPSPSCSKSPKPYPTYYLKRDPQESHNDQEFFRGETPTSNCSSPSKNYEALVQTSSPFFNSDPCVLSAEEFLTTAAGMAYLESMKKNNKE